MKIRITFRNESCASIDAVEGVNSKRRNQIMEVHIRYGAVLSEVASGVAIAASFLMRIYIIMYAINADLSYASGIIQSTRGGGYMTEEMKRLNVRINALEADKFQQLASVQGKTVSELARQVIAQYISKEQLTVTQGYNLIAVDRDRVAKSQQTVLNLAGEYMEAKPGEQELVYAQFTYARDQQFKIIDEVTKHIKQMNHDVYVAPGETKPTWAIWERDYRYYDVGVSVSLYGVGDEPAWVVKRHKEDCKRQAEDWLRVLRNTDPGDDDGVARDEAIALASDEMQSTRSALLHEIIDSLDDPNDRAVLEYCAGYGEDDGDSWHRDDATWDKEHGLG